MRRRGRPAPPSQRALRRPAALFTYCTISALLLVSVSSHFPAGLAAASSAGNRGHRTCEGHDMHGVCVCVRARVANACAKPSSCGVRRRRSQPRGRRDGQRSPPMEDLLPRRRVRLCLHACGLVGGWGPAGEVEAGDEDGVYRLEPLRHVAARLRTRPPARINACTHTRTHKRTRTRTRMHAHYTWPLRKVAARLHTRRHARIHRRTHKYTHITAPPCS